MCEAVRRAVGDDCTLMLDATRSYDFPDALRVGKAVEVLGSHGDADPLSNRDISNSARLTQHLAIPLMATEYPITGLDGDAPWILARATDWLRGDVAVKGGITTLVKASPLVRSFPMNLEIHHGGNSPNSVADLHGAMAIRNTASFGVLLPDAARK